MTRARDLADFNLDGKAVTVNESSADLDFRVESNGNANMLFVDGGNDKVAIGTGTAVGTLTTECTAGDSNFALTAYHPTSTSARTIAKFQSNVGGTQQDKVVILCDSKVGINTSSPSGALLDIFTGSTSTDGLKINRFDTGVYYSTLRQDTHGLAIHVGDGSSIAERAAITPNGITFGGSTAAADALDDYEEGTFTPEIRIGGSTSGITNNSQVGQYTKIGRMVTLTGRVSTSNIGSNTGAMTIHGMPFASQNTSNLESIGSVELQNMSSGTDNLSSLTNNNVHCRVSPNVLTIEMRRTMLGANDITNVQMTDTTVVSFTITYFT